MLGQNKTAAPATRPSSYHATPWPKRTSNKSTALCLWKYQLGWLGNTSWVDWHNGSIDSTRIIMHIIHHSDAWKCPRWLTLIHLYLCFWNIFLSSSVSSQSVTQSLECIPFWYANKWTLYKVLHILKMPKMKRGNGSVPGAQWYEVTGMNVQLLKCLEQKGFLRGKYYGITGSVLTVTVLYCVKYCLSYLRR